MRRVSLRRDVSLHGDLVTLPPDAMAQLKNAPCIGTQHLFDPVLVQSFNNQQVSRANVSLAMRAYIQPAMAPRHQGQRNPKSSQSQPYSGKRGPSRPSRSTVLRSSDAKILSSNLSITSHLETFSQLTFSLGIVNQFCASCDTLSLCTFVISKC